MTTRAVKNKHASNSGPTFSVWLSAIESDGEHVTISAEDGKEKLTLKIRASADADNAALSYLDGELGNFDDGISQRFVGKRLPRWAWDRVAVLSKCKPTKRKYVYVISCVDSAMPLCKIGVASAPVRRLAQLSTSSPHKLKIECAQLHINPETVESAAHSHFSEYRRNGEWFGMNASPAVDFITNYGRT